MTLQGKELNADNISFNIAREQEKDCILYWGLKGLGEVQFVRVFKGEYSGDMYLATATYKIDIDELSEDFIGKKMGELASIQQLKKK